jgi:NADPH-dependent ferric siderophore reductase
MSKPAKDVKVGDEYWFRGKYAGTITAICKTYAFSYTDKNGNHNTTMAYDELGHVESPPSRWCKDVEPGDTVNCCGVWRIVTEKRRSEDGFVEFVFADATPPQRVIYKEDDLVRILV